MSRIQIKKGSSDNKVDFIATVKKRDGSEVPVVTLRDTDVHGVAAYLASVKQGDHPVVADLDTEMEL